MITSKLIPSIVLNEILPKIRGYYDVGTRYYHTFDHARDVLNNVERVHAEIGFVGPVEAALAALYHDAFYVVGDPSNEDKSAIMALEDLSSSDAIAAVVDSSRVAHLTWLTKYHFIMPRAAIDEDARLFLDCDIFGFAAPWPVFRAQNEKLDKEFSAGKKRSEYLVGRMAFLKNIGRGGVFNSEFFRDKFEETARINIATELKNLDEELRAL